MKPLQFRLLSLLVIAQQCHSYNVGMTLSSSIKPRMSCHPHPTSTKEWFNCNSRHSQSKLFAEDIDFKPAENENKGMLSRFVRLFKPKSSENMTTKELLAKMGISFFLSYGFVSNMTYCVSVSLAWFGFTKKTGLSPLAPGQWKGFLAVYAGFFVFGNIIRPLRMGLSVGVAKYFDAAISYVQEKIGVSKPVAIGIVVLCLNIVGTCSLMALGISLASLASGVPIFPPKA